MTIGSRGRIGLESDDKPTSIECCDNAFEGQETQDVWARSHRVDLCYTTCRIRHAGLGGLENDPGHLVAPDGTRNTSQGLLVIDLQEYCC